MPYTDLSYYKLNVHFQIRPVWPERLQARSGDPKPFFFLFFFFCSLSHFIVSSLSKRQPSSSDCCRRVHVWNKAEG